MTNARLRRRLGRGWFLCAASAACGGAMIAGSAARALGQVVSDGSLGPAGPLGSGPQFTIPAAAGRAAGGNLFHSFSRFDIPTGGSATFVAPGSVNNVLARVTGGTPSTIDGRLATRIEGTDTRHPANLYLINPSGVVFRSGASLDIGGSFTVTTADVIKFADGGSFDARSAAADPVLSAAAPAAFGFLGRAAPARVTVEGHATIDRQLGEATEQSPRLSVGGAGAGRSLTVVAGGVRIVGGALAAPGGTVRLVAVSPSEEIPIDAVAPRGEPATRGRVELADGALVTVDPAEPLPDLSAGSISLRGGEVVLDGVSTAQGFTFADGGDVEVDAFDVAVVNQSRLGTITEGQGRGGTVRVVAARSVSVAGYSQVSADTDGSGPGGDVEVAAPFVSLDGFFADPNAEPVATGIAAEASGTGTGGSVRIGTPTARVGRLDVVDSASISATTVGPGHGGRVDVYAGRVVLDGAGFAFLTGIAANTENVPENGLPSTGPAGDVRVDAADLRIVRGAGIGANSLFPGAGTGGNVRVVAGRILLDGKGSNVATGINANSGVLLPTDATDPRHPDPATFQRIDGGPGGNVSVAADSLRIVDGASIRSNTVTAFNAGRIDVKADRLFIDRQDSFVNTGIGAQVEAGATGGFGQVSIDAGSVTVLGGGRISVTTAGTGSAGALSMTADTVSLARRGRIESSSESTAPDAGAGGDLTIAARRSVSLRSGARITAQSEASDAGNISIQVPTRLVVSEGEIVTRAALSGGNIKIDPKFLVLNGNIQADAVRESGGDIDIRAGQLIRIAGARISSRSGPEFPAGLITISAGEVVEDLASQLVQLPGALADEAAGLRDLCAVRYSGPDVSSFVVTDRGGVAPQPGAWTPSEYVLPPREGRPPAGKSAPGALKATGRRPSR